MNELPSGIAPQPYCAVKTVEATFNGVAGQLHLTRRQTVKTDRVLGLIGATWIMRVQVSKRGLPVFPVVPATEFSLN